MIAFAIIIASLIVGAVYLSHKIAYQVGHSDGWTERDCKATKECEKCVIRTIQADMQRRAVRKIHMVEEDKEK